jgi:hypothetical protein
VGWEDHARFIIFGYSSINKGYTGIPVQFGSLLGPKRVAKWQPYLDDQVTMAQRQTAWWITWDNPSCVPFNASVEIKMFFGTCFVFLVTTHSLAELA